MVFYFEKVLPHFIGKEDRSYLHPALQLAWRLDELVDRLDELKCMDTHGRNGYRLSIIDKRYSLPKDLDSLIDVEDAISFAKEDLRDLYDIDVDNEQASSA